MSYLADRPIGVMKKADQVITVVEEATAEEVTTGVVIMEEAAAVAEMKVEEVTKLLLIPLKLMQFNIPC